MTLYEPTGKLANTYAPLASVVVLVTTLPDTSLAVDPSALVIVRVTPGIPSSPESCTPSRLVSAQTKLPTLTFGDTKPKSSVVSLAPSVVKFVDVALPVDESFVGSLPANAVVAMYPDGVTTVTLYEPTGRFSNT